MKQDKNAWNGLIEDLCSTGGRRCYINVFTFKNYHFGTPVKRRVFSSKLGAKRLKKRNSANL